VIEGLVPPGSWHYNQPLRSGQLQRVEGRTYNELLSRIFLFRLQHIELVPAGTAMRDRVQNDVLTFICTNWPQNCTGFKGELPKLPEPQGRPTYVRPSSRIENWFAKLSTQELRWIDSATAAKRARVCIACPLNQNWQTGCSGCNANLRQRGLLLRGSHKTGFEPQLKACLAYGFMNEVSVWLDDVHASATRKAPPECWQRQREEAVAGAIA
jgi:hypothetical protein